jgi:enamine deaminase RidA (YjgF/YER057c/UK114 family)
MERERLNPPGVHTPLGNYSHVARAGNVLYLSGQIALDKDGNLVGLGDPTAQIEQIFSNIQAILQHYGASLDDVMKTNVYLTNPAFRAAYGEVRNRLFKAPYPASTLVTVSALAVPELLAEIEVVAAIGD